MRLFLRTCLGFEMSGEVDGERQYLSKESSSVHSFFLYVRRPSRFRLGSKEWNGTIYDLLTNTKVPRIRLYLFVALYKPVLEDPLPMGGPNPNATTCWLCNHGEVNHSVSHLKKNTYVKGK